MSVFAQDPVKGYSGPGCCHLKFLFSSVTNVETEHVYQLFDADNRYATH